jgi:hypothetical protein
MKDRYEKSHLWVAAIRMLEHQTGRAPSVNEVCEALSFSLEEGNFIGKKLVELGVIDITEGPFGTRLFVANHTRLEEIPRSDEGKGMAAEIEKFRAARKNVDLDIEAFKQRKQEEQRKKFAEIEEKLKKGLGE